MIKLIIFDLDNTLVLTDDLEEFRGKVNVGRTDVAYKDTLQKKLKTKARRLISSASFVKIKAQFPNVNLAVFTKSPRCYAEIVLQEVLPDMVWDALISYDDVEKTKPVPDGIYKIAKICNVTDRKEVIVVGDDLDDVDAAYRAGVRVVLAELHQGRTNYQAKNRIPDAIVRKENTLLQALFDIESKLPILEKVVSDVGLLEDYFDRVCSVSHFPPDGVGEENKPFWVLSLGRLFAEYQLLKPRRDWHKLTAEITKYKDTDNFPVEWAECVCDVLREQIKDLRKDEGILQAFKPYKHEIIVTVAPSKKGRLPRMENFLERMFEICTDKPIAKAKVEFNPSAFVFSAKARSHHGEHLNAVQRFENVRDCLEADPSVSYRGKVVFLIDDVVTTGATLFYMAKYCREQGAEKVICVSLAQTVSVKK